MAFTVTLLFFIFSWLLGLSFLSLFTLDINSREKHLIAPTVGFCISTLIVYFFNISDLPIDLFSRQLLIAQIIFILIVLILKKPSLVIDITKPALIILSISLVRTLILVVSQIISMSKVSASSETYDNLSLYQFEREKGYIKAPLP